MEVAFSSFRFQQQRFPCSDKAVFRSKWPKSSHHYKTGRTILFEEFGLAGSILVRVIDNKCHEYIRDVLLCNSFTLPYPIVSIVIKWKIKGLHPQRFVSLTLNYLFFQFGNPPFFKWWILGVFLWILSNFCLVYQNNKAHFPNQNSSFLLYKYN